MSDDIEYTLCDDCGVLVPEANFEIHQARSCGGRARAAAPAANVIDISEATPSKRPSNSPGIFRSRQRQRIEKSESEDDNNDEVSMDAGSNNAASDREDDDDEIQQVHDVVDLTASPDPARREETATNEEWSCPKCTLLNPKIRPRCEACQYENPDLRGPDATRTERLIDDFDTPPSGNGSLLNVGGGALLGGLLGGAASYMRGRSVADGMMEGAVSGAVGGALVDSMLPRRTTTRSLTAARSGAAMGHPAYPSLSPARAPSSRQAPRASFQVRRQRHGNGRMVTTVIRSDGTTRFGGDEDPLMALMMAMAHGQQGQHHGGVDGMNYEELLNRFGDGTENMGADEGAIAQLPVSTIGNPEKELPEDSRQCCICLDDFIQGASRKTLPCLHGFHEECIDRALRNRGCCPMCNQSVR